jgi:predicted N-acetyltransferase YhbS
MAEALGAPAIYLLTTTAERYFPKFGFEPRKTLRRQPTRTHPVLIPSELKTESVRAASTRFAPRRETVEGQSGTWS